MGKEGQILDVIVCLALSLGLLLGLPRVNSFQDA